MEYTNETERFVAEICKKAFLSLWSISNPYSDEAIGKNGIGNELCDLLVVFEKDVLIFSVKHRGVHYKNLDELLIAWGRWYRKAVVRSVKQINGAEKWIVEHRERIFYDKDCQKRIELFDDLGEGYQIHRIAISLGTLEAVKDIYADSSGTLIINTGISGDEHLDKPFNIGIVENSGKFIHVFDESSIKLVLSENDTINDFVAYLKKREKLFCRKRPELVCPGEEQLLGLYFRELNEDGDHDFIFPEGLEDIDVISMTDDFYSGLIENDGYKRKKAADEISYAWDRLIERFIEHREAAVGNLELERVVRILASENRLARRELSEALISAVTKDLKPGMRFARAVQSKNNPERAYLILVMARHKGMKYSTFREARRLLLEAGSIATKDLIPDAKWIIGLGLDSAKNKIASEDLLVMDTEGWGEEQYAKAKEVRNEIKFFQSGSTLTNRTTHEYPDIESPTQEGQISLRRAIRRALKF